MFCIADTRYALPLHLQSSTRRWEMQCRQMLPPHSLMRRAGLAVARLALAIAPHAKRIWIAAGPGNNGGDGLEAALQLQSLGFDVRVTLTARREHMPADAQMSLARALAAGVQLVDAADSTTAPTHVDLAIDALLGMGGDARRIEGTMHELISQMNALPCPVLAVDLPSGLHCDTGHSLTSRVVRASHTLSLLTLKPGLFTGTGREYAGEIWQDSLQEPPCPDSADAWLHGREPGADLRRGHHQHKGSFGDVTVVGGAPGMTGAARLAARAAHAAGAGRVLVCLLDEPETAAGDALTPELMYPPGGWAASARKLSEATVVCGCGGGDAIREHLPQVLHTAQRLVIDADALNAIASDPPLSRLLQSRAERNLDTILTPHPLEAARLWERQTAEVQSNRLHAAQCLSEQYQCVVVLKGSGSVICAPGHLPRINSTGNATLASAGTGDVLAGWIGGLWSQLRSRNASALDVATWAVAQHGAAAEQTDEARPLRASDLIERLYRGRPAR